MSGDNATSDMMARAAAAAGVPVNVLQALLALESDFKDFSRQGVKTSFADKVSEVIEAAAAAGDGTS